MWGQNISWYHHAFYMLLQSSWAKLINIIWNNDDMKKCYAISKYISKCLPQNQQICTSPILILLYIYIYIYIHIMWFWHDNLIELTWPEHHDFTLVPERRKWLEWKEKFHLLGTTAWQVVAAALEYGDVLSLGPCPLVSWVYGESWHPHCQWCLTLQSNTRILNFLMCKSWTNFYSPIGCRYQNS